MSRLSTLIIALCLLSASTLAGEIKLTSTFFGGWKYSLDGTEYKNVGFGNDLRWEMAGNDAAQEEMSKYETYKGWATLAGIPCGFLLGWPLGGCLANSEWKDSYTIMYMIGVPLTITSLLLDATATRKLKKAVRIYNGEESAPSTFVPSLEIFASSEGCPRFGLSWRF
jgi:hypothetical protein